MTVLVIGSTLAICTIWSSDREPWSPPSPPSSLPSSQLIPKEVQEKWQKEVDGLDAKLGGTPERPIELTIVSLDTPDYMTSVCSAGAHVCVLVIVWEW